jgi:hypothetical protein
VVLTNSRADKFSASRSAVLAGVAMVLSVITVSSARAGGVGGLSCVGGARSFNCVAQWATAGDPYVRTVPEALSEAERAQAAARDRKWQTRCHPVVEHDIYGVARYQYSAAGCEYGVGAD